MIPGEEPYLVIDASVSLKWVLDDEENVDNALALRDDGIRGRFQMVAPSLWFYEVGNGVATATRQNRVTPEQGRELLAFLATIHVRFSDCELDDCYRTALRHRIAFYDASYLALAIALGTNLWTGDRKFFEIVRADAPFVRWIGDYPLT